MALENCDLVKTLLKSERSAKFAQDLSGRALGSLKGTIVDIRDPENLGRVKVLFDSMNNEIQNQPEAENYVSHWVSVSPSFVGRQTEELLNARVTLAPVDGKYDRAIHQDIIYEPETNTISGQPKPQSSTMTRLPVYLAGKLPPPQIENLGCMAVEMGGPLNSDWVVVCLRRNGNFHWVRMIDMQHSHVGGDDVDVPPNNDGTVNPPSKALSTWDYVIPTTDREMPKLTFYGTKRPNMYGENGSKFYGPAPYQELEEPDN